MKFDVAIVGAGAIGLASALCMSQRGLSIGLFDQRSLKQMKRDSHRVYALNEASIDLLDRLALLPALPPEAFTPYSRMHVWVANSHAKIDFDARLMGQSKLGAILSENALIEALYAKCAQTKLITFIPETPIQTVHAYPTHIELTHEQQAYQATLLMVADGPNSQLRQHLNVATTQWSYKQEALVATVSTSLPHANTCYQCFTSEGPLALLPLDNPHHCSIVWSTSPAFTQSLMRLSPEEFDHTLTDHFQHKLGTIQRLTPLSHFPLSMRHVKQYVGERWIILGDAAHTVHPMAGLGLNVGFADLMCWLRHFDHHQLAKLPRALQAYQRERKTEVWKIICMLDGLKMLFSQPMKPIQLLRDLGIQACDALPMLKRFFIAQAQMGRELKRNF